MGTERDDLFSGKVIGIQECGGRHRDGRPPVRISQQDHIIFIHIINMDCQLRTVLTMLGFLGFHQDGTVVIRIWVHHRQFDQVRPGLALDLMRDPAGVPAPGIKGDQHFSAVFRSRDGFRYGHASAPGVIGIADQTDAQVEALQIRLTCRAVGTAHVLGEVIPAAAPVDVPGPRGGTGRISGIFAVIWPVIVPGPFIDIPVAVIQPPAVRRKAPDLKRMSAVFARLCFQYGIIEVILLDLIRIMPVEVRL